MQEVAAEGRGLIIYEHQEGRGIGLMNKLRAYELQDHGADTVEANEQLGFESDLRNYLLPGAILRHLGIRSVRLLSNNPDKVQALEDAGVTVAERVPVHRGRARIAPGLSGNEAREDGPSFRPRVDRLNSRLNSAEFRRSYWHEQF